MFVELIVILVVVTDRKQERGSPETSSEKLIPELSSDAEIVERIASGNHLVEADREHPIHRVRSDRSPRVRHAPSFVGVDATVRTGHPGATHLAFQITSRLFDARVTVADSSAPEIQRFRNTDIE